MSQPTGSRRASRTMLLRRVLPALIAALLIGLAMNFLGDVDSCNPGIAFTSKFVLRLGVALLGLKITLTEVMSLGWSPFLLVVGAVALTLFAIVELFVA